MLKWLVTGREQSASQLAHKKITKKKSSLKHEASSEDGVAVIDNVKFNITRVNPLFSETDQQDGGRTKGKPDNNYFPETHSSGYWSFNDAGPAQRLHHMTGVLVHNTELETCYSSTDTTSLPSPVWPTRNSQDRWFLRQDTDRNRCFDIRHQQVVGPPQQQHPHSGRQQEDPSYQNQQRELESENDEDDEYVSDNDPENSNDDTDQVGDKSREDMNKVIAELTSAIVKSKAVSAMTHANTKANKAGADMASSSKTRDDPNCNTRSRTLKSSQQMERARKKHHSFYNKAYLQDERTRGTLATVNVDHFSPGFVSSSDWRRLEPRRSPGVWRLSQKQRQAGLCGELDYKNYNYNYELFLREELQRNYLSQEWWTNYGHYVTTRRKRQKWCKTLCKSFCFVILLISFVVVVICVSVFIIKDKYNP